MVTASIDQNQINLAEAEEKEKARLAGLNRDRDTYAHNPSRDSSSDRFADRVTNEKSDNNESNVNRDSAGPSDSDITMGKVGGIILAVAKTVAISAVATALISTGLGAIGVGAAAAGVAASVSVSAGFTANSARKQYNKMEERGDFGEPGDGDFTAAKGWEATKALWTEGGAMAKIGLVAKAVGMMVGIGSIVPDETIDLLPSAVAEPIKGAREAAGEVLFDAKTAVGLAVGSAIEPLSSAISEEMKELKEVFSFDDKATTNISDVERRALFENVTSADKVNLDASDVSANYDKALSLSESSGRYDAENSRGFIGERQVGIEILEGTGYLNESALEAYHHVDRWEELKSEHLVEGGDAKALEALVAKFNVEGPGAKGIEELINEGVLTKDADAAVQLVNNWSELSNEDWTAKGGITSKDDFLNNPEAQDIQFQEMKAVQWGIIESRGLDEFVGKELIGHDGKSFEITQDGLMAATHLGGAGGLENFLKNGADVDDGATNISHYLEAFSKDEPMVVLAEIRGVEPAQLSGQIVSTGGTDVVVDAAIETAANVPTLSSLRTEFSDEIEWYKTWKEDGVRVNNPDLAITAFQKEIAIDSQLKVMGYDFKIEGTNTDEHAIDTEQFSERQKLAIIDALNTNFEGLNVTENDLTGVNYARNIDVIHAAVLEAGKEKVNQLNDLLAYAGHPVHESSAGSTGITELHLSALRDLANDAGLNANGMPISDLMNNNTIEKVLEHVSDKSAAVDPQADVVTDEVSPKVVPVDPVEAQVPISTTQQVTAAVEPVADNNPEVQETSFLDRLTGNIKTGWTKAADDMPSISDSLAGHVESAQTNVGSISDQVVQGVKDVPNNFEKSNAMMDEALVASEKSRQDGFDGVFDSVGKMADNWGSAIGGVGKETSFDNLGFKTVSEEQKNSWLDKLGFGPENEAKITQASAQEGVVDAKSPKLTAGAQSVTHPSYQDSSTIYNDPAMGNGHITQTPEWVPAGNGEVNTAEEWTAILNGNVTSPVMTDKEISTSFSAAQKDIDSATASVRTQMEAAKNGENELGALVAEGRDLTDALTAPVISEGQKIIDERTADLHKVLGGADAAEPGVLNQFAQDTAAYNQEVGRMNVLEDKIDSLVDGATLANDSATLETIAAAKGLPTETLEKLVADFQPSDSNVELLESIKQAVVNEQKATGVNTEQLIQRGEDVDIEPLFDVPQGPGLDPQDRLQDAVQGMNLDASDLEKATHVLEINTQYTILNAESPELLEKVSELPANVNHQLNEELHSPESRALLKEDPAAFRDAVREAINEASDHNLENQKAPEMKLQSAQVIDNDAVNTIASSDVPMVPDEILGGLKSIKLTSDQSMDGHARGGQAAKAADVNVGKSEFGIA
jgi:hypothetical protein